MCFFEKYESLLTVIFSFFGLILVIVGWFVANKNAAKINTENFQNQLELEDRNRKMCLYQKSIEWEIQYIDNQIRQFYGPIFFKLKELEYIRLHIQEEMGTGDKSVFPGSTTLKDLTPENQKIWIHFIDNYQIPIHNEILKIMFENSHLSLNNSEHCIYEFKDYVIGTNLLNKQYNDNIPNFYEYSYSRNYPKNFNKHIEETLKKLENQRAELIKKLNDLSISNINQK